jgi:DNA-binding beta-propeller fold protein YncE
MNKILIGFFAAMFGLGLQAEDNALVLSQTIPVPGLKGGFNHMSVDAERQLLFAAAPTNQTVEVIDLKSGQPQPSLGGSKPAAVRYAPEFGQLYVSRTDQLTIHDAASFKVQTEINLESSLDELQYNPTAKQLYVGCMTAGKVGIAIISIPEGKVMGKVPLPGKPQGVVIEQKGRRLFANMPSAHAIAVVDGQKALLLETWPVDKGEGNSALALDEGHGRLFVACRRPTTLFVFDTTTGKSIASVPIDGDTDDMFYDPTAKRVYISGGKGFVDVIDQVDADHYQTHERIRTAAGARTSTFDATLGVLCVGVPKSEDEPAKLLIFRTNYSSMR